jgi:hypothetical protein
MAITDRRLKLLHFPEENVSDLRAAVFVETRTTVNNYKFVPRHVRCLFSKTSNFKPVPLEFCVADWHTCTVIL